MREVPGSNPIGDVAFFAGKTCSTVTLVTSPIFDNMFYVIKSHAILIVTGYVMMML